MRCPGCGKENSDDARFCNECGIQLDTAVKRVERRETSYADTSLGNDFVGRKWEMAELLAALDDAFSGQGRLLMLAGEPGIGKTRTAQALASYAEKRGAQVFWGWCYEEEGAPPYWPWVQAIRSYVQQTGTEQLWSEMGPGAAVRH